MDAQPGEEYLLKQLRALRPQLRRNLLILFVSGLFFWSSLASLLPILPLYAQQIGGSKHDVGLVMGAFAIGLLSSRSWVGNLADYRGRKIVLLIGMASVAIAPFGYLFATSIPLLMVIRSFHGISVAAFAMAYAALVTDIAPPEHRGEIIGYMSLVNPIGVALGPAIGGLLQENVGYGAAFLLAGGLGALGLLCTGKVEEPSRRKFPTPQSANSSAQPFWQLILSPRIRVPAIVLLLIGIVFGTLSTFAPLFIKASEIDLNVGFFYAAAAIASFVIRLLIGQASDRYGRGLFITISLSLYTLAMLILCTTQTPQMFLLAATVEGMGSGILIPMTIALMSDRSKSDERGRVLSLCMTGFDLGIAVAGPLLGLLAEPIGFQGIFALSAGLSFLALVTFMTQSSKNLKHSFRFSLGQEPDIHAVPQ
jgi:MFS family permease